MDTCKICLSNFHQSPDSLVICEHKGGFVHHGCCINRCSQSHAPCQHCVAEYTKEE